MLELYLNGSSYRDIADILNMNKKSIDNALQRAKRKIREVLNAQRED